MSWWQTVGDYYDSATDWGADKVDGVKEWWTGEEEQVEADAGGIPGSNGETQATGGGGGINWTAASVLVGVVGLASRFIK